MSRAWTKSGPVRITHWLAPCTVDLTSHGAVTNADWLEAERARIGDRATVIPHPARNGKIALAIGPARARKQEVTR